MAAYSQSFRRTVLFGLSVMGISIGAGHWRVEANDPPVSMELGQPSIWSLAQAHYLLSNMHQENRGLKVPMPTTELNPNSINGARLDILRSAFGAEVQFSGTSGQQNRLNQSRYDVDFSRKESL